MCSFSKYILALTDLFNKNVLPHSLGPDNLHLKFSRRVASVIIFLSSNQDSRSSFILIAVSFVWIQLFLGIDISP